MERNYSSVIAMAGMLTASQMIALMLATPFIEANLQVFEDPESVATPIWYFALLILVTAIILLMIRIRRRKILKHVILVAFGLTLFMVFYVLLISLSFRPGFYSDILAWTSLISAIVLASLLTTLLYIYPEWYLVDFVGICVAAAVATILGISLAILPVLILLILLAIYDAFSVYKTKHMITLADAVAMERLPVLLVVPTRRGYSFLRQKSLREQIQKKKRDAVFMGLGDIAIPGVLVVSAFSYLGVEKAVFAFSNILVALSTLLGCVLGFMVLMRFVMKGNPQAGLPLLNGGAIAGYLISYLLFYTDMSFGISI